MSRLAGRVAIVTGAGRGLGRSHALALARQGASVVVNDLGATIDGSGVDACPADAVVAEIAALGGAAVASHHDVSSWRQASELVELALAHFGALHVLVNNAGNLRDRTLARVSEDEWDDVIRVHLKGHAATTHHAMAHWRAMSRAGEDPQASLVHTSSLSGLAGNVGQANYAAAKLGIVALSRVAALEGARHNVRSNVVAPSARTRMAVAMDPSLPPVTDEPGAVSVLVAWLAETSCPATSQVFHVAGERIRVFSVASVASELRREHGWDADALASALPGRLAEPLDVAELL